MFVVMMRLMIVFWWLVWTLDMRRPGLAMIIVMGVVRTSGMGLVMIMVMAVVMCTGMVVVMITCIGSR